MAEHTFDKALNLVLAHEGGFSNHPSDPGGATMRGVTQRVYDGYRRRKGFDVRPVRNIASNEIREIYWAQYWLQVRAHQLPAGIDYVVFDGAANSGPAQSVKWLQRALGMQRIDGVIGEATLSAIDECEDQAALIRAVCARRMTFLRALKTWPVFGRGWSSRVTGVQREGLKMLAGRPVSLDAMPEKNSDKKAPLSDAKRAPQTATADLAAGGGAIGTPSAAGALDQTRDAITPIVGTNKWIDFLFASLVVVGAAITIGGIIWGLYARKKRKERMDALDLNPEMA